MLLLPEHTLGFPVSHPEAPPWALAPEPIIPCGGLEVLLNGPPEAGVLRVLVRVATVLVQSPACRGDMVGGFAALQIVGVTRSPLARILARILLE